jgi:hypothetical protein
MFGTVNEAYADCLTLYVLVKKFFERKLKYLSVETNERALLLGIKTNRRGFNYQQGGYKLLLTMYVST